MFLVVSSHPELEVLLVPQLSEEGEVPGLERRVECEGEDYFAHLDHGVLTAGSGPTQRPVGGEQTLAGGEGPVVGQHEAPVGVEALLVISEGNVKR